MRVKETSGAMIALKSCMKKKQNDSEKPAFLLIVTLQREGHISHRVQGRKLSVVVYKFTSFVHQLLLQNKR